MREGRVGGKSKRRSASVFGNSMSLYVEGTIGTRLTTDSDSNYHNNAYETTLLKTGTKSRRTRAERRGCAPGGVPARGHPYAGGRDRVRFLRTSLKLFRPFLPAPVLNIYGAALRRSGARGSVADRLFTRPMTVAARPVLTVYY